MEQFKTNQAAAEENENQASDQEMENQAISNRREEESALPSSLTAGEELPTASSSSANAAKSESNPKADSSSSSEELFLTPENEVASILKPGSRSLNLKLRSWFTTEAKSKSSLSFPSSIQLPSTAALPAVASESSPKSEQSTHKSESSSSVKSDDIPKPKSKPNSSSNESSSEELDFSSSSETSTEMEARKAKKKHKSLLGHERISAVLERKRREKGISCTAAGLSGGTERPSTSMAATASSLKKSEKPTSSQASTSSAELDAYLIQRSQNTSAHECLPVQIQEETLGATSVTNGIEAGPSTSQRKEEGKEVSEYEFEEESEVSEEEREVEIAPEIERRLREIYREGRPTKTPPRN